MSEHEKKHKSGLVVTLDYGTIEESKDKKEPIYIYKDIGLEENNITMSIEEAKWLRDNLDDLIHKLSENNE